MTHVGQTSQGPAETIWDTLRGAPIVLRAYAKDIERHGRPLDSGLAPYLTKLANAVEESQNDKDCDHAS